MRASVRAQAFSANFLTPLAKSAATQAAELAGGRRGFAGRRVPPAILYDRSQGRSLHDLRTERRPLPAVRACDAVARCGRGVLRASATTNGCLCSAARTGSAVAARAAMCAIHRAPLGVRFIAPLTRCESVSRAVSIPVTTGRARSTLCVSGFGGVGKTQLAAEYCHASYPPRYAPL